MSASDLGADRPARLGADRRARLGAERRARLADARLYLICDAAAGDGDLPGLVRAAVDGGVQIVQLRDKRLDDDELTGVANALRALCERLGVLLIVNDRPAVALAAGADGVHVGQDDLPVAAVRELVGPELLIGLSTHTPAQIDAANMSGAEEIEQADASAADAIEAADARGADAHPGTAAADRDAVDYIGVGPVYETPTKPGRPAVGLDLVGYAAAHARPPFFAIGGIDAGNLPAVVAAGATRAAVVRAITDAAQPEQAARELRELLDRGFA
jgi:thiamine-phosphate pyrophosphorylase